MSQFDFDAFHRPSFTESNSPASVDVKQLIAKIKHSHDLCYNLINLETWALADTMDDFLPGFWSRFLTNRRTTVQQFLQRKRSGKA